MENFRLYLKMMLVAFRSQMEHRASFIMLATTHFFSTFVDIFGIWVLFDRFQMMKGWTFSEVALIYGIMHMGFSAAEAFARGFDTFSVLVKNGDFDRILLRPLSTFFQMAASAFQWMRIGRFLQGLIVLLWGCIALKIELFSLNALILFFAFLGTMCLFYGLFVMQATLTFWTTETLELMNILTYGGLESGQYPLSIYKPAFRAFFTFMVPLACVAYFPISGLLQKSSIFWLASLAPIAGVLFLFLSFKLWNFGVRHYQSTGN